MIYCLFSRSFDSICVIRFFTIRNSKHARTIIFFIIYEKTIHTTGPITLYSEYYVNFLSNIFSIRFSTIGTHKSFYHRRLWVFCNFRKFNLQSSEDHPAHSASVHFPTFIASALITTDKFIIESEGKQRAHY